MSLIDEALRRAQEEAVRRGEGRGTQRWVAGPPPRRRPGAGLVAAVIAGSLAVGLGLGMWWSRGGADGVEGAAAVSADNPAVARGEGEPTATATEGGVPVAAAARAAVAAEPAAPAAAGEERAGEAAEPEAPAAGAAASRPDGAGSRPSRRGAAGTVPAEAGTSLDAGASAGERPAAGAGAAARGSGEPQAAPAAPGPPAGAGPAGRAEPQPSPSATGAAGAAAGTTAAGAAAAGAPAAEAVFHRRASLPGGVTLSLHGIAFSERGSTALINGEVVAPGEQVGGYTVVEILPDRVRLRGEAGAVVLRLK